MQDSSNFETSYLGCTLAAHAFAKEFRMEAIIANLVQRFEKGRSHAPRIDSGFGDADGSKQHGIVRGTSRGWFEGCEDRPHQHPGERFAQILAFYMCLASS
jgi:hypothetical protein